jgi:predicted dehydrogenase
VYVFTKGSKKLNKINIAVVGMSFGLEFVPIYLAHPNVGKVFAVDTDEKLLTVAKDRYNFSEEQCISDFEKVINDPEIDAIHLVTPPSTHAPLSIRVLNAGKNCACTIPMGMSIDELYGVIEARKKAHKKYMFMETTVYEREFLYIQELAASGKMGRLQYMTCAHYQDMEGWPKYWDGFPPLMHPTHAISPCVLLTGRLPAQVYGRGSGRVRDELIKPYGCPFSFESALVNMEESDITIEMERFLYGVARSYSECFRIYAENISFEWQQAANEEPMLFERTGALGMEEIFATTNEKKRYSRGSEIKERRLKIPDYASRLPEEIAKFTERTVYNNENTHLSFTQGGGHGGSHPHLIHEFVKSIIEDRNPMPDDIMGAYLTGVGILAHESAMAGGKVLDIPQFKKMK